MDCPTGEGEAKRGRGGPASSGTTGRIAIVAVVYLFRVVTSAAGELHAVARGDSATHRHFRDRLVAVLAATVGFDLICALLAFLFEQHGQQTQIKSLGSALFWTSTQLLTVSSSIQNPVSTAGRALDVVMEAYALTVVATLAGATGAFLQKRGEELADEEAAKPKAA